jgi:uncharacterized OB-fold protein
MNTPVVAELPHPTVDSQPFWEGCQRGQLLLQRCADCHHLFYYARRLCPACGGTQLQWEAASGQGVVYSYSQVQVAFQGPHWQSQLPYTVVLIDLVEGPRMLSRWVGPSGQIPQVGQRARLIFVEVQGQRLPYFEADESGPA